MHADGIVSCNLVFERSTRIRTVSHADKVQRLSGTAPELARRRTHGMTEQRAYVYNKTTDRDEIYTRRTTTG